MEQKKLYRSTDNRVIAGVAAGMAAYFNVDPTVMRAGWVLLGFFSGGTAILAYTILIFVIPAEPSTTGRKKVKNNKTENS